MQRLGVSRAAVSRRLFSNNAKKEASPPPQLVEASAGRILSIFPFKTLTISLYILVQNSAAPSKKMYPVPLKYLQKLQAKNTKPAR